MMCDLNTEGIPCWQLLAFRIDFSFGSSVQNLIANLLALAQLESDFDIICCSPLLITRIIVVIKAIRMHKMSYVRHDHLAVPKSELATSAQKQYANELCSTWALERGKHSTDSFFKNWFLRDCDLFSGQKLHFCGFSIDSKNISKASNSSQVSRYFGHQIYKSLVCCAKKNIFTTFYHQFRGAKKVPPPASSTILDLMKTK